jgi:deazaflavin-dependent oxidoreductase (nitroreductase family)
MHDALSTENFCYLTTTGRKTGRPHEIEIWFALHAGRLYLLSGGGRRSDWVRNLMADEHVDVRIAGRALAGVAEVVPAPEDDGVARRLLASKYQGWREGSPLSHWAESALLVRVELTG